MRRLLPILLVCVLVPGSILGRQQAPVLSTRVTDFTNSLTFVEWRSLETMLGQFADTTGIDGKVLIVSSPGLEDINDFSSAVFATNRLDSLNNGRTFLLVISPEGIKASLLAGGGLKESMNEAVCRQIAEDNIRPRLKQGAVFAGLLEGVDAIIDAQSRKRPSVDMRSPAPLVAIVLVLVLAGLYWFVIRPRFLARERLEITPAGWIMRSGWGYVPRPKPGPKRPGDISGSW